MVKRFLLFTIAVFFRQICVIYFCFFTTLICLYFQSSEIVSELEIFSAYAFKRFFTLLAQFRRITLTTNSSYRKIAIKLKCWRKICLLKKKQNSNYIRPFWFNNISNILILTSWSVSEPKSISVLPLLSFSHLNSKLFEEFLEYLFDEFGFSSSSNELIRDNLDSKQKVKFQNIFFFF